MSPSTNTLPANTPPQVQAGALAYRRTKSGDLRVLLITKRRSKHWGIPKGNAEPHLSLGENAAKEAFEEAGIKGVVSSAAAGVFRTTKRNPRLRSATVIEVWVYLLEVTRRLSRWPEKDKRKLKWVTCDVAAVALKEPVLVDLCRRLETH
jgi:8-oxo-dGTP pyrophosphatase MutT (NUDIX family)